MDELDGLVTRIAEALESAGIPHAFGGAIALAYWAPPRSTADIDLNLFVTERSLEPAFDALEAAGFRLDRQACRADAAERGDFRAWCGHVRLDVFISFAAFHDEVARRAIGKPLPGGRSGRVISAEDLIVFKVLFDRSKDWIDIEKMIRQQGSALDASYLRHWCRELLPEKDDRLERLDRMLR